MAEFDVPGLGRARMALTEMAKKPQTSRRDSRIKIMLVRSLYTEIRAARLAGHSWREINESIRSTGIKPLISNQFLSEKFHQIDKEYENNTGVKALPVDPAPSGGGRKRK